MLSSHKNDVQSFADIVNVSVLKFDYSSLILLDLEVKINVIFYCSLLLLWPVIRQVSGKFINSATVYRPHASFLMALIFHEV